MNYKETITKEPILSEDIKILQMHLINLNFLKILLKLLFF